VKLKKIPYLDRALEETVPELKPFLKRGRKVLDAGCGPGTITLGVAAAVDPGEVVGFDPSEESIEKASELAREKGTANVSFRVMDTHSIDFPDGTFDLVYSHTALHAFRNPVGALVEQKRVTKPGGWLVAAGVRDWGLVPRFPPTPNWERVYEARDRYAEKVNREELSGGVAGGGGDMHAGRKCASWFRQIGLRDVSVQPKAYRVQYAGSEACKPHMIDALPYDMGDEYGWLDVHRTVCDRMVEDGYIDRELLTRAIEEAEAWYRDPAAFHFWVMVFVAGRV